MNDALAFLLSRAFDGSLAPEHLADLRKSGLTDETIAAQYFRSVPPSMWSRVLGFDPAGIRSGGEGEEIRLRSAMLLPYRSPASGFMDHARVKVFPALTDKAGHSIKYLQRRGSNPRLYFVASVIREVLEGTSPIWIIEGEKKTCCVAQLGLPAVGVAGVEGWHVKGSHELLGDFDGIPLDGRVVELVPDGDYQTNVAVARAIWHFSEALRARGARPRVVVLPSRLEAER